ncbi:MAG: AsmA-like C-terminal region-containing protein [Methylacidiphilales bacterium]|nr:AsmA-like C-terminal region-containing protein [Candidatus Methylacidiphilales bacterium]
MPSYRDYFKRLLARLGLLALVTVSVPLLVVVLWLRFLGLPPVAKDYVLNEIQRRHIFPFPFAVDRLLLSPTGAIIAERVTVYRDANRQSVMLLIDRIRIGIAWLSWWQGRGFIDGAAIANADVRYPIGPEDTADFTEVNADVAFDGRDIKIQNAQARFLNMALYLRGIIHNDGFPSAPAKPPPGAPPPLSREEQVKAHVDIWHAVRDAMDDIGTENPIDAELDFETSTSDLGGGRANFVLNGRRLTWRSAPVDEISIHGSLSDGIVTLDDFKIGLDRGELTAFGEWDLAEHSAELQFTSSMDFTTLAPAFPGPLGQALGRLDFPNTSPAMTGLVRVDLRQGFYADVEADLDWRDFTFNGVPFSRFSVPVHYDGKRLLISGLKIAGQAGDVDLEFSFDSTQDVPSLNARISSNLAPTVLKGVFGEGMDNFLGSCSFQDGGPKIDATATGTALNPGVWTVKGKVTADKFVYKNAGFDTAASDFTFADSKLNLPNLEVHRPEGAGTGGIVYDFKNRSVALNNFVAQVDVQAVAPVMGPKFIEYTAPYHFSRPPTVRANGLVDLQSDKKDLDTDLLVEVEGKSPMGWTLFSIPFNFDEPNGTLTFKNRRLTVDMKKCGFYDGGLTGVLDMDLRENPAAYTLDLNLSKVNFKKFTARAFSYDKSTGQLNTQAHFTGEIGQMETMTGGGEIKVENGDITQIPFLGSLTPLIPGFSAADAAHGHFTVAKGLVHTDDMNISSETLALIGNGNYNFMKDRVDLDMRVNANALFGILLYPISKIFEYHGTGPMKDVKWVPKNF